jgi:hypothetical protein
MTRSTRLLIGGVVSWLVGSAAAGGCATAEKLPADERVRLELVAIRAGCFEYLNQSKKRAPDLDAICGVFTERDDAAVSGDSGPP